MNETEPLPETWLPVERELRTFYRALPRLLKEGGQNKYVVVRGNETFNVWDHYRDASQFGYQSFDDGKFLSQKIDSRMLAVLAKYFGPVSDEGCIAAQNEAA